MKHNKKKPCAGCPFLKKSLPGYLGPWTPQELRSEVMSERGFACHMDIDKAINVKEENKKTLTNENLEQCAGAIMFANKCAKRYQNPELATHQEKLRDSKEAEEVLGFLEFQKHHVESEEAKKFRRVTQNISGTLYVCDACGKEFQGKKGISCPACGEDEKLSEVDE